MLRKLLLGLLFSITFIIVVEAAAPKLETIWPQGNNVDKPRQIVFSFDRPMVPLGRMEREASEVPISFEPAVQCNWRWANTSTLICNIPDNSQLAFDTEYKITVDASLADSENVSIGTQVVHKFKTRIAAVEYASLVDWETVGTPVLQVYFSEPIAKELVAKNMFLQLGNERIELRVDPYKYAEQYKQPGSKDDPKKINKVWQLTATKELPINSKFSLMMQAGANEANKNDAKATQIINTFHTFPAFKFIGVECYSIDGKKMLINSKHPQAKKDGCNPTSPVSLVFSSPVSGKDIKNKLELSPEIKSEKAWNHLDTLYSSKHNAYIKNQFYNIDLPHNLKPNSTYEISSKSIGFWKTLWRRLTRFFTGKPLTDIQDEFGRFLEKPFSMKIYIDHRAPNFVLSYENAVVEKDVENDFPIYVNNLNSFSVAYNAINTKELWGGSIAHKLSKVDDIQYAYPLGLKRILKNKSGAIYATLNTDPQVLAKINENNSFFTQITPYNIHFKYGHYNSLAWVTDLKTGLPVEGAEVAIYKDILDKFKGRGNSGTLVRTDKSGLAILPGTKEIDPKMELAAWHEKGKQNIFVMASKGEDMALLPVLGSFISNMYQSSYGTIFPRMRPDKEHITAWGTSAQGIYRLGDTIQYKMYVRDNNLKTFQPVSSQVRYKLIVKDPLGKTIYENDNIKLDAFGGFSGELKVAESAAIGWYYFSLHDADDVYNVDWMTPRLFGSFNVLVTDFTPASFKVLQEINGERFNMGDEVVVKTSAQLYAGGAFKNADYRVTATLDEKIFSSKEQKLAAFNFSKKSEVNTNISVFSKLAKLNDNGEGKIEFILPKQEIAFGKLHIESSVDDERGKKISKEQVFDYYGIDRLVGINPTQWVYASNKEAEIEYAVVDVAGYFIAGTEVDVIVEQEENLSSRVKSAGNAYRTVIEQKWNKVASCKEKSTNDILKCKFIPKKAGTYKVTATIKDTKGRIHNSESKIWVSGNDYVLWDDIDNIALSLTPEKKNYKVGDTAKILVKNPYPGAQALITVERYGVLNSIVKKLESSSEIIELPITEDYLPGVYVSVIITSPRVDKPVDGQGLDLGKPTYKMGYLKLDIADTYKQLKVGVEIEKEVYKPREKVKAKLQAKTMHSNKKEPIEFVVAVVDEAVLDLNRAGADYYNPYKGFYKLGELDLQNYTLLTRLMGKQRFEKKGANQGGDGGVDISMRDVFKFVTYWNPGLKANANGEAAIEFEVPDNLTNWRVIAMAVTPTDQMGVGAHDFKVSLPTEIRPIMPNQIAENDEFKAGFRVMNRMNKERVIDVEIKAEGTILPTISNLKQQVSLKPFDSVDIWMNLEASKVISKDDENGKIVFTGSAHDAEDGDAISHTLKVLKMRSIQRVAQYGSSEEPLITQQIQYPKDMYTDVGGLKVTLSPTIIGNITGAFAYIKEYPFQCLEQRLSKGLMAAYYELLPIALKKDFEWKENKQVIAQTLESVGNFQAPSGGMAYFIADNNYVDPYLSAYTYDILNQLKYLQYPVSKIVEEKLTNYLKNLLKENNFPSYYTEAMVASTRAYIVANLGNSLELAELTRLKKDLNLMDISNQAAFIEAGLEIAGGEDMAIAAAETILSHSNQSAGSIMFSKTIDSSFARILNSSTKDQCAVLNAFLDLAKTEKGAKLVGDIPIKLVPTILQKRGNKNHWNSTQENLYCTEALLKYSFAYEKALPNYSVNVSLDEEKVGVAKATSIKDNAVTFNIPFGFTDPGRKLTLNLDKAGQGRLYYNAVIEYASVKSAFAPVSAGLEIVKEYRVERNGKWQLLRNPMAVKRGELVRVDIIVKVPTDYEFIVLEDFIPGGLEGINADLATSSTVDVRAGSAEKNWVEFGSTRWSFYHKEMSNNKIRFYSDYLTKGTHHVSYAIQAIAEGEFYVKPSYVERMYNPEVFGLGVEMKFKVAPKE